jgi:RND family efflux transporter MFP subunit
MEDDKAPETGAASGSGRKVALGIGVVAVLGIVIAVASGGGSTQWSDEGVADATVETKAAPAPKATVEVKPAAQHDPASNIRGVVRSRLEATISSRITAKITSMPYREGQSFARGALLVAFDCATLKAQLNAANAATSAYRKTHETNVELDTFQAVGRNDVEISKANMDKAGAEAHAISAQMSDCVIHAPFAGVVVEQIGHAHEVAASGQPLMKIQNGGDLEVQLIVPSGWLTWLKPGVPFDFKLDETGETVKGRITQLGAAVDPVSKTLRIAGTLEAASRPVLPGMSGSARFDIPSPGGADGGTR